MNQNEATAAARRIPVYLEDDDGEPVLSLTFSGAEVQLSKNGETWDNADGSLLEVGGSGLGAGAYYYQCTVAETDTVGFLIIKVDKAGAKTYVYTVDVTATQNDITAIQDDVSDIASSQAFTAEMVDYLMQAAFGRWKIEGTQLIIYTWTNDVLTTFDLKDENGDPSNTSIFERAPSP